MSGEDSGRAPKDSRGFTLLELSIVLALIAVITGGGLVILTAALQASQVNVTVARMDAIEKALLDYITAYSRIPCPGNYAIAQEATNDGVEAGTVVANTSGTCHGGTPAANYHSTSGVEEGGVPTRALRLPDAYMYDGWNRRFRYAVDPSYTVSGTLPVAVGGPCSTSASPITVNDSTGAARTTKGIYAIISHGANGHGAYTSNGVTVNAGSTNTNEWANCNCTSGGTFSGTYTPTYVEMAPTLDPSSATDNFDDIVTFKEAWQMQRQNLPLTTPGCLYVYVMDTLNKRVQKFDSKGNFILAWGTGYNGAGGTIGSSGSGNGQFYVFGSGLNPSLYIDSSHNVWVSDSSNQRVQEFDSYGNYKNKFGSGGTATGQFYAPGAIAIDRSGNIWVTDMSNRYRIEEWNSSLVSLAQVPTPPPASPGFCNGHFTNPEGMAIDSSGNIWVTEWQVSTPGLACLSKFNSSGVYQSNISTGGNRTSGIFFGTSGNMWVADSSLDRIYTFTSAGVARNIFSGNTVNYFGSSGAGDGKFNNVMQIYVDSSGNIWAADMLNHRIEKFDSSGTFTMGIGAGYNGVSGSKGSSGLGNGQFDAPSGVYLDTQ